jgi:hypothetical protein
MRAGKLFKLSLVILAVAGICTVGFAKDAQVGSVWTTAPPKIDGLGDDWADVSLNLEEKLDVNYAFRNDQKFMYILFSFNNPKFMSTVNFTGLTMYINTAGKKKKDYSINFAIKNLTNEEFIALLEARQGPLDEDRKNEIMANPSYAIFDSTVDSKGKGATPPGTKIVPAVYRIQSDKQKKTATYEIAIPLDRAIPTAPGIGAQAGSDIKIGFAWGGWTKELKEAAASRVGAQGSQARSGQAGRVDDTDPTARANAPGSSLTSLRRAAPKKYDFWVDVKLAGNQ